MSVTDHLIRRVYSRGKRRDNRDNGLKYKGSYSGRGIILTKFFPPIRQYSTLTHVDGKSGKARMVDVGEKEMSKRTARAKGAVIVGPTIRRLIEENNMKKGDVFTVAQLAGIIAAKKTADLIPLCHPLSLNYINVRLKLHDSLDIVEIQSEVRCTGKTGVEMEALTAVAVAALTVYDMCKSVTPPHNIVISDICLISKTGGSKGDFNREDLEIKGLH